MRDPSPEFRTFCAPNLTHLLTHRYRPLGSRVFGISLSQKSRSLFFWVPGQPRTLTVASGSHAVGAREVGGTQLTWPAQTVSVPSNGTFNLVFTC